MYIVGLISGTSADAIDAGICRIVGAPPDIEVQLIHALTYECPAGFQQRVWDAGLPSRSHVDEICQLNADLGEQFAAAALAVISSSGLAAEDIDLIGSHGQTVWHMVEPSGEVTSTLQLAEGAIIAERTGITTVNNFRARDIAAGGQGAPLTSYADWLLLRHPDHWRAAQNLGGIGNVTFLPPISDNVSAPISFDTGPGNSLIDTAMHILSGGTQGFDRDGQMAAKGHVNDNWLNELLAHPYYEQPPPKTTGRELFGAKMGAALISEGHSRGLSDADIVATLTALTAASIADACERFAPAPIAEVVLHGGGVRNPVMVEMLRNRLDPTPILTNEDVGLDNDNMEALVFALLAHETWHARPGMHPKLTGARHPVILGQIIPGNNFVDLVRRTWCDEG
ncbi:MAG: anhydro-N-acetylmuramic acid kinase [Chloroflexi bacterium]|nr:anhydro-N-acetylmuramic acid kinase [Chloroflexota bacterium]